MQARAVRTLLLAGFFAHVSRRPTALHCQSFTQVGRLEEPCYFSHLLDVVRSPLGRPLLEQVAAQVDKLAALLTAHEPQHPAAVLPEGAGARPSPISFLSRRTRIHTDAAHFATACLEYLKVPPWLSCLQSPWKKS